MKAVELVNVSKSFKGTQNREFLAVEQINVEIAQGEFFSLLGPSGCGKTTTLRMIAGFELPTFGEIYIEGQAMEKRPPFHRPVNTVFQNYALFPHLTVAENVAFGLEMEKIPRAKIRTQVTEVLEMVKLVGYEKRYPRQLSGGQQQRVALARALVKKPKVLLLDEPLGALDLKLRKQMQLELKQMQQQVGITFIYVTHDQEEALTMSDRIAVMNKGKILQVGTPVEIYEEPTSHFVADFIGETNILRGRVVKQQEDELLVLIDNQLMITVPYGEKIAIDQAVNLVIRPEKATLYPANHEDQFGTRSAPQSSWLGKVEEVVYIGTDTRYVVRLGEQHLITIRQQNIHRSYLQQYQAGEAVKVSVSADSIRLLLDY
ncbi:ABC transporter ATP-binding protein [Gloeothece verrucosa]|uniref:Spermidine/putrescine import ATP-binding protein PotA n=1 Tax=Gloeothece verrucosa (strain PCC 7822) TaxID=497965 RepID=E0UGR5_GLOV7|nr:ABC transporter ATP-binding protein [Gloeothece verrucosa]ADN14396.1 spermidine/putrescine ABC transporter ATPase subunit [Gloeothece verrucosa PCC 7822]